MLTATFATSTTTANAQQTPTISPLNTSGGRLIAQRFNQSGVLGELCIGIILGNLCYFFGIKIFILLRAGPAILNSMQAMLDGVSLSNTIQDVVSNSHYAHELIALLKTEYSIQLLKVAYVLDVFSHYGIIFLLFRFS